MKVYLTDIWHACFDRLAYDENDLYAIVKCQYFNIFLNVDQVSCPALVFYYDYYLSFF